MFRPGSKRKGDMVTEENPVYGLSGPHRRPAGDEGDYEIPRYPKPPSEAPEEKVSTD